MMTAKNLTTKEAAELLGLKSPSSLRNAIAKGQLKSKRFGRSHVISEADLMKWVKANPLRGIPKRK